MKNNMMLFFDTMLFFYAVSVNQLFLEDRVKKITTSFASSEIRRCKLLGSCQKIHHPSVNRFDGLILWYVLDYQNENGDDTTKL